MPVKANKLTALCGKFIFVSNIMKLKDDGFQANVADGITCS